MQRAAVLIGVSKSGTLPVLPAVLPGVTAMRGWALDQGMSPELVITLTDESGPLGAAAIKDAVRKIVDLAVIDQLIVYFAGHGVNIRYGEYWLLSDAPGDPQAAVNVSGSVELARFCGIPHVVIFSDACRTAPEGIQAQYVSGSEIFPNNGPGGLEQSVDIFFACTLGHPAHEIKDPTFSASAFKAVYTEALVSALAGRRKEIVVPERSHSQFQSSGHVFGFVRPRKLKEHLRREVVETFRLAGTWQAEYQEPDGRITSEDTAWVSQVPLLRPPSADADTNADATLDETVVGSVELEEHVLHPPVSTLRDACGGLLHAVLHQPSRVENDFLGSEGPDEATQGERQLRRIIDENVLSFDSSRYVADCGFRILGTRCVDAFALRFGVEIVRNPTHLREQLIRVDSTNTDDAGSGPRVDNVLMTFEDGSSVLLPAIPEFLATVSVKDGEVSDISYEPSTTSSRWAAFQEHAHELRSLRSVVGAAANLGVFTLTGGDAPALARTMQVAKGIDPTMSLYAAYAYRDLGERKRIREMHMALQNDLGFSLFDVAMLANAPIQSTALLSDMGASPSIVPYIPLLSPGWSLLSAHNVQLPAGLNDLTAHLHQSLWTTFDATGGSLLRTAMEAEAGKWMGK